MNNTDKALAELLGVGTDTIKNLAKLVGDNYEEIYNTIVKEYTFYTITENIFLCALVLLVLTLIPTVILMIHYLDYPDNVNYKDIFRICCIIVLVLIFVMLIASILSPVLSPNIHFIKELRG